ncbi:cyclodeaminase/cyclohydrolase family protein [Halobacterium yunchengense]|uniref:cyclodeaminase/cyclohydrolase family protein n=1 Tax=Halobacterium yunchengense TaxID=3108497 RepID=UPI00300AF363
MNVDALTLAEFLDGIASERVTPAGGSATAVVGAVGASLCEMACIHADARDGDAATAMGDARETLAGQRERLLALADADAAVVDELFGREAEGPGGDAAAKRALGVPLATAEAALTVLEAAVVVTEDGVGPAAADAAIGAHHARAALDASVFTVRSNEGLVADDDYVDEVTARCESLAVDGERVFDAVLAALDAE